MDLVSYTGMASACSLLSKLLNTAVIDIDGHILQPAPHNMAVSIPHNVEPLLGKIAGHLTMLLDLQFVAIFPFSILITSLVNVELEIGTGHENESSSEVVDELEVDLGLDDNE